MKYDPEIHRRRSIRLSGYDYSCPGAYFVTICTIDKQCLFGTVVNGQMRTNDYGKIACEEWLRSGEIRREIELDSFVLMPNHLHGIVTMMPRAVGACVGAQGLAPVHSIGHLPLRKPRSLASFVWGFKAGATKRINEVRHTPGAPLWQRNYYEHIIRNDAELNKIREYIATNPLRWAWDRENPEMDNLEADTPWL